MNAPTIYYEWAQVLNTMKDGTDDAAALQALQAGTLVKGPNVYERLCKRLTAVIDARFQAALDKFQKTLSHASGDQFESVMSQALSMLFNDMQLMPKLTQLPVLQDSEKQKLMEIVQNNINQIGQSLVKSAKADRSGKLASILKSKGFKV